MLKRIKRSSRSLVIPVLSGLLVAGGVRAAELYYDFDTSEYVVNEAQRFIGALSITGNTTLTGDFTANNNFHINASNGRVGIGTVAPVEKVEVEGNIRATGSTYAFTINPTDGGGPRIQLGSSSIPNRYFEIGSYGNINHFDSKDRALRLHNGSNSGIYLDTTGHVGIGTISPAYRLDVSASTGIVGRFSGRVIGDNAVNADEFVTLSQLQGATGSGNIGVESLNALSGNVTINGDAMVNVAKVGQNLNLSLSDNSITGTKLVNLSITGAKIANSTITNNKLANDSITINTSGALTGGGSVALGSSISLSVNTGGGSGGLGSTFFAQGGNAFGATAVLGTTDNHALQIRTNNQARIGITGAGNVGIGTLSPTQTLAVAGTGSFSDTLWINGGMNIPAGVTNVMGGTMNVVHGNWGSSNHISGATNNDWIKVAEFTLNGSYSSFRMSVGNGGRRSGGGSEGAPFSMYVQARNSTSNLETPVVWLQGSTTSATSVKDVKLVRRSGSGTSNNNMEVWVQFGTNWQDSFPVEINYWGTGTLDWLASTPQPQQSTVTAGFVAEYDVNSYARAQGRLAVGPDLFNPQLTLSIGDSDTGINWLSPDTLGIYTNNTNRLHITSGGNVGINTSSPAFRLDVNGDARFVGRVIGADAVNANEFATLGQVTGAIGSANHDPVTLTGQNYLTLSNQQITANAINLSGSHVTGTLPIASGGTGATTAGTALSNLGGVPTARTITAGTGLTGGGNLTADRTLAVNFGTAAGTVAQGNDSRIVNGQTAFGWGDHSAVGYLTATAINTSAKIAAIVGDETGTGSLVFNTNPVFAGNVRMSASSYLNFGATSGTSGYGFRDNAGTLEYKDSGGSWSAFSAGGSVTSVGTGAGLTGGPITTTGTIALTGQSLALHNLSSNGLIARTGSGTVASRTITGGTGLSVTNGDGVSGNPAISFSTTGNGAPFVQGGNSFGAIAQLGTNDNQPLVLRTNNSESMRILQNGNVGIGTTTPAYRLDVAGGTGIVGRFSGRVRGGDAVNSDEFATLSQVTGASHSPVTLAGQNYLSLSGQQITANAINLSGLHVTGTLGVSNGGTGATTLTGVAIGNGASAMSAIAGTANQFLRRNSANNAYEFATISPTITLGGNLSGSVTLTNLGNGTLNATIANSAVSNAMLRNSVGLSVIGRASNSTGDVADIVAGSDGQILRRAGTTLGFGALDLASANALSGILGVTRGGTGTGTAFAPGSIVFAGVGGVYSEDNANFFWDNTNKRLGIGTATPSSSFHVAGNSNTSTFDGNVVFGGGGFSYTQATNITAVDNLALGAITFDTDAGIVSWIDMPVSNVPSAGTIMSYTAQLDGNPLLTVYGEADGSGGVQNTGVGIGTTNPTNMLSVGGSADFSGRVGVGASAPSNVNFFVNGNMGIDGDGSVRRIMACPSCAPISEGGDNSWSAGTSRWIESGWSAGLGDYTQIFTPGNNRADAVLTLSSSGNISIPTSSYLNWGSTLGTSGYGFRDNAGTLEYKNSGGSWSTFSAGGSVTSVDTGTGLTGGPITTTGTIALTGQALALHNLSSNGLIARTGSGAVASRTITGGTGLSVTNGNGVSGNPSISLATTGNGAPFVQGGNSFGAIAQLGTNDNQPLVFRTNNSESMRVLANGNVGLGTTTPAYLLDVSGGIGIVGRFSGRVIGGDAVNANEFTTLGQVNTAISNAGHAPVTLAGQNYLTLSGQQITASAVDLSGSHVTGTIASARVSGSYTGITGTGTLNVGSISSGFGNINIGTSTFTGNGSGLTNLNASNLSSGTVPDARIAGSYTGLVNLTGSGNVDFARFLGNAADTAAAPSYTWTGNTNTGMFRAAANVLGFSTNGTESMRILANGNVGIGTTTPSERLHVVGNSLFAGNIRLSASSYVNFGATGGASGYGIRDNAGAIEFKNSAGSWTALGAGGATTYLALTDTPSTFTTNAVPYTNSGGTALAHSSNFTYNGTTFAVAGTGFQASSAGARVSAGSVSTPSFSFTGDTDTGMYNPSANSISFTTGGVERLNIDNNGGVSINGGYVYGDASQAYIRLSNAAGSYLNYGVGGDTSNVQIGYNNIVFRTADTVRMRVEANGTVAVLNNNFSIDSDRVFYDSSRGVLSVENMELGPVRFEENAGYVSWIDMDVTSTATAGSVMAYAAQIDGSPLLTLYSQANGSGGIQRTRVVIGETSNGVLSSPNLPNGSLVVGNGALCVDDGGNRCANSPRTAGRLYARNATVTAIDVAETFPTKDQDLQPAEIMMFDPENPVFVRRYSRANFDSIVDRIKQEVENELIEDDLDELPGSPTIAGIYSTNPGLLLGGFNDELYKEEKKVALALSGRVPLKVNLEGGDIRPGDRIAISNVPGVGRKADSSGWIVGVALEPFNEEIADEIASEAEQELADISDLSIKNVNLFEDETRDAIENELTEKKALKPEGSLSVLSENDEIESKLEKALIEGVIQVLVDTSYYQTESGPYVAKNGNVGVGTKSPEYKLHVAGSIGADELVIRTTSEEVAKNANYTTEAEGFSILDQIREAKIARYSLEIEGEEGETEMVSRFGFLTEDIPSEILSLKGDGIDMERFVAYTISGMKALVQKVDAIELRVANLESASGSLLPQVGGGINRMASLAVGNLTVGSKQKPSGITIFDKETGDPYCVVVIGGKVETRAGECNITPAPTPTPTPTPTPPPVNEPTTPEEPEVTPPEESAGSETPTPPPAGGTSPGGEGNEVEN